MKKTFQEILSLPYSVIRWQKDTDMIRISYPTERGFRHQDHKRKTWEANGFTFDMRMFNGGTGGRKKLPDGEKKIAVISYHKKYMVDDLGGYKRVQQLQCDTVVKAHEIYKPKL